MDRFVKFADLAQVPFTIAAYGAAAVAVYHYLLKDSSMTWQVLILGAIVALGLFATVVQIGALRVATRKVPAPSTPSIELRDEPVAVARTDYFELGLHLGRARQFDDRVLTTLSDDCKKLGLSYSAAKVDRILDTFSQERDEIEVEGGTITNTLAIFDFQMNDMEDAVRSDLLRAQTAKFAQPDRAAEIEALNKQIEELSIGLNARFNIGFLIGQLKASGFDQATVADLKASCDHLGLSYTAARLQRILDARDLDQFRHEEYGTWDISNTEKVFDIEMKDMESVVLRELERMRQTDLTPNSKRV